MPESLEDQVIRLTNEFFGPEGWKVAEAYGPIEIPLQRMDGGFGVVNRRAAVMRSILKRLDPSGDYLVCEQIGGGCFLTRGRK